MSIYCPNCGETLSGDGYHTVMHCPYADERRVSECEPDADAVYCSAEESE